MMMLTREELAEAMGVTTKTITDWSRDSGMPMAIKGTRGKPNQYKLKDVLAWYVERELAKKGTSSDGSADGLTERRKKLLEVKTAREEIKRQREAAEVILADVVQLAWSDILGDVRRAMLNLPPRLATKLLNKKQMHEIEAIIKREVHSVLTTLSRPPEYKLEDINDEEEDDSDIIDG